MNERYGLTVDNILRTLPEVFRRDEKMYAIASAIAPILAKRPDEIKSILIYPNIDNLSEELLDILAYDFKVDWYGYNYNIEAKRNLIRTNFEIHRHLGTKGAVTTAINAIYPDSLIEEWFEYDGAPYSFHVVLNVGKAIIGVVDSDFYRAVELYKSYRSDFEGIIMRSHSTIKIGCTTGYALYTVRMCGTYPSRAQKGEISTVAVLVATNENGVSYAVPSPGQVVTGTHPSNATKGAVGRKTIVVAPDQESIVYGTPKADQVTAGTYPVHATLGATDATSVNVGASETMASFSARPCGTPLENL